MFSKLIFYTLLNIATICIASEQTANEPQWFTGFTFKNCGKFRNGTTLLIIKCYCAMALPENFSADLDFEQNTHGQLFAIYAGRRQTLGCWPNRQLITKETMTTWYYGTQPHAEIQIPFREIKQPPTS